MAVMTERHGATGLVVVDNQPVNALSREVRAGLIEAVGALDADAGVDVIAIVCEGRTFIAGADIREFSEPAREPFLPAVIAAIEGSATPVVAVIHGTALGGGFEVALASHARVALPGSRVGLPEINLGVIPGSGGTQRVPRLAGVEATVDLVLSARPIPAEKAAELGLVDRIMTGEPRAVALAAAEAVRSGELATRRTGELPPPQPQPDVIAAKRAELEGKPGTLAARAALDAIEASSLPIAEGMARERALFEMCRASDERAALVHIFFAERAAPKVAELEENEPRPIRTVGVVGGGTMGSGIAAAALMNGFDVVMVERDEAGAVRGRDAVSGILDGAQRRGRLTDEARAALRFTAGSDYEALRDADLVVEAAFEDMGVKKEIFARLDRVARKGAVLATNTSYLDVDEIARATGRPGDVVGLHFFSPAYVMRLLEVVIGNATAPDVVATAFTFGKALGKVCVPAGVADGFIGNRIFIAYRRSADIMMEDGASPYEIDSALVEWGFPMGPYQAGDFAGQDIGWATRKRRAATRDPAERYVRIPDLVCERGWFGRKTGRGFYRYPEGAKAGEPDEEVLALIAEERARKGITPRNFTKDEIVRRILCTMINEGARALDDGTARRASDIDVVMVNGYGFPRFRGGPMKTADIAGLPAILKDLQTFAADDPAAYAPARLLVDRAGRGMSLV